MCLVNGSSLSFEFRKIVKIFDRSILRCFFGLCKSVLLVWFDTSSVAYLVGTLCMFEVLVKLPVFHHFVCSYILYYFSIEKFTTWRYLVILQTSPEPWV